jgi:hypothetical protein
MIYLDYATTHSIDKCLIGAWKTAHDVTLYLKRPLNIHINCLSKTGLSALNSFQWAEMASRKLTTKVYVQRPMPRVANDNLTARWA